MSTPRSPVIYEVVRRLGEEEMDRPVTSLLWSGFAAGLSITFSVLAEALLRMSLPEAPWRHLVTSAGYSIGFLIVILGRQQLFTESTITVILPLLKAFNPTSLGRMARLWSIVLAANLAGTLAATLFCWFTPVLSNDVTAAMVAASHHLIEMTWWETLLRGITAGFLMAALVWILPTAETAKVSVILILTYLIAVGGFAHVIAGSMEAYLLALAGQWAWWQALLHFIVPALIGNILGGTALFGLIAYAQVMKEI